MHTANSIIIRAPKDAIFETAANLELWPKILPHYRYIRYLERGADRNLVVMAARRWGLPISWTSEQTIDRDRCEVRFHHLKAWTKGMDVSVVPGNAGRRPGRDRARVAFSDSVARADRRTAHQQTDSSIRSRAERCAG